MHPSRRIFHKEKYRLMEHHECPLVDVKICGYDKPVTAYVDTGCSRGLAMTKRQFENLGLDKKLEKMNTTPGEGVLADGTKIAVDWYRAEIEVGDEKKPVGISVMDPSRPLGMTEAEDQALLGRRYLDYFDVVFSGIDKTLTFMRK